MSEDKILKVLITDDHQMLIDGIKSLLRKEKNIQIVAEANSGKDALDILRKRNDINLLITDINMPEMSGTELVKIVKKDFPEIKVLVLTMYNDPAIVNEILMVEAEGFILKNTGKQELINAIYKIADNGTYYSNEVMSVMMKDIKRQTSINEKTKTLSPREVEIIKLIVQELTTNQIAEKLFISPRTVDTHRKNILQKINTKTLVGLIKFAFENKLVD
jgi:DNA-binding NarL/FixJ family response regulator